MVLSPPRVPVRDVPAARLAVAAVFFANGLGFASWSPHIPRLQERLGLGEAALGFALLGVAVGSLVAMPLAGALTVRVGSRPVTRVAYAGSCLVLPLPALAPTPVLFALALAVVGGFMGSLDVAMNAQGVAVERRVGHPILSSLHGTFSVGAGLGALLGGGAVALAIAPALHLAVVGAVLLLAVLPLSARLLRAEPAAAGARSPVRRAPVTPALLSLGAIAFAVLLAEGSMIDWSAIYLRDVAGPEAERSGVGALGYAAFSITMAAGRFAGDRLVARVGPPALLRGSALLGAGGLGLGLLVGTPAGAIAGFAVLGLGLSTVVPVVFSAAGRALPPGADRPGPDGAGPAISAVSTIGYLGFLAGPPLIGLVAEAVGLPVALGGVAVLVATIPLLARAAAPALTPARP